MFPRLSLDRQVVSTHRDQTVHVMVELTAPPAPSQDRPPLDLVVVIDRSGSMSGPPLRSVTEATAQLLRLAGPDDRIGVVTFDNGAHTVLPLDRHEATDAAARVRSITSGGSTNLSAGWLTALDLLVTSRRPEALRRILVLTDGQVNVGVTDADSLASMVAGGAAQGVTTSCIGFRDGFDEQLLSTLADAGRGNDYWCADSDQAMAVFTTEFGGLATVVAQNLHLTLRTEGAVASVEMLQDLPSVSLPDGRTQISLGDAYGDETRRVVMALRLRSITTDGDVSLGDVELRWVDVTGDVAHHSVTLPIVVTADSSIGDGSTITPDPAVAEHVARLRADQERRNARRAWDRGDREASLASMHMAADFLDSSAGISPAERARLGDEFLLMETGRFDAAAAKRMHSGMRSRAKGRNLEFEADEQRPGRGTTDPGRRSDPDLKDPNR